MWRVVLVCTLLGSPVAADRLGTRWQQARFAPVISRVWGTGTTFYGAGPRGAYRSLDGGETWSEVSNEPATAVFGSGPEDVWIVQARALRHSSGKQWTQHPLLALSFGARMEGMWGAGRDLYVYGVDRSDGEPRGAILRSRDRGASWQRETLPAVARIAGMWGDDHDLYAVGSNGILHSAGDGEWELVRSGAFEAIWGSSATAIYAVGANGSLVAFDGKVWSPRATGVKYALSSIIGVNGEILVGSPDGAPLRSTDGKTWVPLTAMVSRGDVTATSRGHVVVASSSGVHFLGETQIPDLKAPLRLAVTPPLRQPDTIDSVRHQLVVYAAQPNVKKLLERAVEQLSSSTPSALGEVSFKLGAIASCSSSLDRPRPTMAAADIPVDLTCAAACQPNAELSINWSIRTPAGPLGATTKFAAATCSADLSQFLAIVDGVGGDYQKLLSKRLATERVTSKDPAVIADALARYVLDGGRESQPHFDLATLLSRSVTWRGFFWNSKHTKSSCSAEDIRYFELEGDNQATSGKAQDAVASYSRVAHCSAPVMLKLGTVACRFGDFRDIQRYYEHLPSSMATQLADTCARHGFDPRLRSTTP